MLSLPDRCGRIDRSNSCCDLWSGRCPRCRCVHYLNRTRLSHHVDGCGRGVDVCNDDSRRIPSPRVVVVVAVVVVGVVAAATVAIARGGGLLGQRGERREVATP